MDYENLGKLNQPFFEEYTKSFRETLESGWYILGRNVEKFEKEFAQFTGGSFCAGVANGLDALTLALKAFELPENSEVLVPSNTYIASILAILQAGLTPVLVEPDIETYNIDPLKIESKITKNTKALMVVHLYGKACSMEAILDLVQKYSLKLVEDCAQAHGAKFKGKQVGTFGDYGAFSFYPTKNLGALGDAGALVCSSAKLYDKILYLRNYGSKVKYQNEVVGYNSRLDEIQAGFLSIKLAHLEKINAHKRKLAEIYFNELKAEFVLPKVDKDYFDVFHIFNIRHPKRDQLKQYLLDRNIKTEIHYPIPPHRQTALANIFGDLNYPIADEIHKTTLSLPISYMHKEEDIQTVVKVLNEF